MGNAVFSDKRKLTDAPVPDRMTMPEVEEDRQARKAQLQRVMDSLLETTSIMHQVMHSAADRGAKIEDALQKSEEVADSSHRFRRLSASACTRCWLDVKQAWRYSRAMFTQWWRRTRCLGAISSDAAS